VSPELVGLAGVALMLVLILLGVPIGWALLAAGALGNAALSGVPQSALQLVSVIWENGTNFLLIALPMFVLMGQLTYHAGIAPDLYDAVHKWLGRLPGGLAVSATMTSAAFGAVTGSSFATVHTVGTMVMPELKRYGYDMRLGAGSIASAGTLAILIPPSVIMVVYGIFTETSIGDLFIAGILPGIVLTVLFAGYIVLRCVVNPALGPRGPRYDLATRVASLWKLLPPASIFLLVIGGIYVGVFSPTEAAGIGAAGVFVLALAMGRVTRKVLWDALRETATVSGTIFVILIGGLMMSRFLIQTGITPQLVAAIGGLDADRYAIMALFVLMYLALGCVLDVLGMIVMTLPFVFPIVIALGFDAVWLGVFITVMAELALITPPIGLNVFIIRTVVPDVPLTQIFAGVMPFVLLCLVLVALLLAVPELATWLPATARR
jgi:tripartite ATP-independent transporter DctM subunit